LLVLSEVMFRDEPNSRFGNHDIYGNSISFVGFNPFTHKMQFSD